MTTPLVIVGAGGHGRELLSLIEAVNCASERYELLGFLDDGTPDAELLGRLGLRHLGPINTLESLPRDVAYLLGLGSPLHRRRIVDLAGGWARRAVTAVHPTAVVGSDVRMAEGVVVAAQTSVTTNVDLGKHVHLNVAVSVAHDVAIGDYATLSPGSRVSGNVAIGAGATLGTGAVVLPGVRVGADAVIGAGAVVTRDVATGATVAGVPARPLG